jgi:hypothetical protein
LENISLRNKQIEERTQKKDAELLAKAKKIQEKLDSEFLNKLEK